MSDAKPLTREEREVLLARARDTIAVIERFGDDEGARSVELLLSQDVARWEGTVREAERRAERLHRALNAAMFNFAYLQEIATTDVVKSRALRGWEEANRVFTAEMAKTQASGDYSVTRTPESGGGE